MTREIDFTVEDQTYKIRYSRTKGTPADYKVDFLVGEFKSFDFQASDFHFGVELIQGEYIMMSPYEVYNAAVKAIREDQINLTKR